MSASFQSGARIAALSSGTRRFVNCRRNPANAKFRLAKRKEGDACSQINILGRERRHIDATERRALNAMCSRHVIELRVCETEQTMQTGSLYQILLICGSNIMKTAESNLNKMFPSAGRLLFDETLVERVSRLLCANVHPLKMPLSATQIACALKATLTCTCQCCRLKRQIQLFY